MDSIIAPGREEVYAISYIKNPIASMVGTVGILAPVVMQKVEEVGDRASWFIFDLLSKVEFLCKVVSMNCLPVSIGCPCSENNITSSVCLHY